MHLSVDDKNKIKIGPPGEPLVLAVRSRPIQAHENQDINGQEHGIGIMWSLAPSV